MKLLFLGLLFQAIFFHLSKSSIHFFSFVGTAVDAKVSMTSFQNTWPFLSTKVFMSSTKRDFAFWSKKEWVAAWIRTRMVLISSNVSVWNFTIPFLYIEFTTSFNIFFNRSECIHRQKFTCFSSQCISPKTEDQTVFNLLAQFLIEIWGSIAVDGYRSKEPLQFVRSNPSSTSRRLLNNCVDKLVLRRSQLINNTH